jgi:RNA polymerase sigma factor (sigma-70 family)
LTTLMITAHIGLAYGVKSVKTALTEFYKKNYKDYLARARNCLKDHHYAEDVVQEAFENALKYSYTFNEEKELENWFNSVFMNTLRDYLSYVRNQGVVVELTIKDHPQFPKELVDKYRGVIEKEIHAYDECPRKRHILSMYFLQGYPARAAAIVCDCSESAVYNLSHRFRVYLEVKYGV